MAANLQRNRGLANLGKRLARQIRSRDSLAISLLHRRSVQASAYEKNPEENVNSTLVPDHVIPPQSDEYWAPHPKTGVFGPATDENPGLGRNPGGEGGTDGGSVLEEKAFFRPLKDLEKPPVQPSSLESHN
ncbi:late embryogenesis abundant protein At5g17165-like [Salvia splendens]|uniref:late embryogenesis abundant protein At5g17165-like n=1 Tax=Salvia splendens TaxID=180675 RepID=UPI001C27ED5E|nr:late embryogenesis abundant protein At5g17165-like [Salvia splendens]